MLLTTSIVGCSGGASSKIIKSDGNGIYLKNSKLYLTEYDGIVGSYRKEGDPIIVTYGKCIKEIRDCPENRQAVHEADLSSYKKAEYFDAYINTFSVMHIPFEEETTIESTIETSDKEMKPLDTVRGDVYTTMTHLEFKPIETAIFNDCIIVKGNGLHLVVRDTDITIPSVLTVFKGSRECTQQVEIGEITCMKYESNNFNFYQYGDSIIKISKDYNVEDYITLTSLE